jgi:hypothetical protein
MAENKQEKWFSNSPLSAHAGHLFLQAGLLFIGL